MGEYASYRLNNIEIYSLKNASAAVPFLMEAFSPADLIDIPESGDDDNYNPGFYGYKTTVSAAKDRLEVYGFSFESSLEMVRASCRERLELIENPPEDYDAEDIKYLAYDDDGNKVEYKSLLECFNNNDMVLAGFSQIFSNPEDAKKTWWSELYKTGKPLDPINAIAKRIIEVGGGRVMEVIPTDIAPNPLAIFRIILEAMDGDVAVEYDCTMPIRCWDCCIEDNLQTHLSETVFSPASHIIVLTEGPTDDEFIRESLELLFPNISHMFEFFDYHNNTKPERNCSALAKICTALASVQIQERFIFLFDNDAAGKDSFRKIPTHFPPNMQAVCLPDLAFAADYPTIGPDGPSRSNLNGRAVTIEFFLGENAMRNENGAFFPVEWVGMQGGEYQGKLAKEDKESTHEVFRKALAESKIIGKPSPTHDWEKMVQLITLLVDVASSLEVINRSSLSFNRTLVY